MHKIRSEQNKLRISTFLKRIPGQILTGKTELSAGIRVSAEAVPFSSRQEGEYRKIGVGERWGDAWDSAWIHLEGLIPESWKTGTYALQLDFNGEALIYDSRGLPLYGLTNGSVFDKDYSKDLYRLTSDHAPGDRLDIWVEAAANHLFGIDKERDPERTDPKRHGQYEGKVNAMYLCRFDEDLWHLWLDVQILSELIGSLPENSPRCKKIIHSLCEMIDLFNDDPSNSPICREHIRGLWGGSRRSDLWVTGIGHAHIDTGWLWPVKETIRKCARTFASQIDLIDKYPDYVFGASQPQHYLFVKEHYPELYGRIKELVAQGRWEIQGGMWVEADCNVISGESMIRQFLHGKNFFMDEFSIDVKNLWLPDVFGYSAAMPQILKKSGVDFFMTQKISWNQYNKFPFHLFNWRGIDGTEVVTHFLPENNYNSSVNADKLCQAQERFNENHISPEFVSLFGIGNGGGGPREEHIERGLRLRDLEGAPKWRFGKAGDAFERMKSLSAGLETWSGELYLELHRGTLTTQALTKKYNRKIENRLRALEYICSSLPFDEYPAGELDGIWKKLLMNQFHDIIPGSSIKMVYDTAHREYELILEEMESLFRRAGERIFKKERDSLTLVNILSCEFHGSVSLPRDWKGHRLLDTDGSEIPVQQEEEGCMARIRIAANQSLSLKRGDSLAGPGEVKEGLILENELIRYEMDPAGRVLRGYDKIEKREVLKETGNILTLYGDRPLNWDAWDIDIFYEDSVSETAQAVEYGALPGGPVRRGICFKTRIASSSITQRVSLEEGSKRLDFDTVVDWKERHRMLRTAFPLNVLTNEASCDIQYGYVKRPTHRNTSWDMAKFEVAAHRYVDLSDSGYGAALLNDCKYGYKAQGNIIDLNLLRSPAHPDADADIHEHSFRYSLLPHKGSLIESSLIEEAAVMNNPPLIFEGCTAEKILSPCSIEGRGVSLEVLKKGEKENCHILRLVETHGKHSRITLRLNDLSGELVETDLMEWNDGKTLSGESELELQFTPFEIRTFKLRQSGQIT